MALHGVERKLTAILSADVKGYSRLMGEDEVATIRTLTAYREVMASLVQQRRGRVVDMPGDNLLAEFPSVVDAVQCAVEIQRELKAWNAELPDDRKMQFRIGINLGDVVVEGERIYGDGVNIAARVEGLAEGGGICISGTAYDQVENKLAFGYESLGEHTVKNIKKPIRVYRVQAEPVAAIPEVSRGLPLPDKPSIAVLPFVNMSGDPSQEFFADGLTDSIITALSRTAEMVVIASNSTFAYKGKHVNIQQVGQELRVRYVLEGSLQKSENRVRINAQLIDANKGHHLWAERYDRQLKDVFVLQDEVTLKIIRALQVKLTRGEQARLWIGGTENLNAFEKFYQGMGEYWSRGNLTLARQLFEEAVELDPDYIEPYVFLGWLHMIEYWYGLSKSPQESMEKAVELAQKALALNDLIDLPYSLLGKICLSKFEHERAISEARRAIALNPNGADACAQLACILSYAERPEEALYWLDKAFRLNPMPPVFYYTYSGMAYNINGQYQEAIRLYKKGLTLNPNSLYGHLGLTESYSLLGREEEARASAAEVLRIHPGFSAGYHVKAMGYKNQADEERFLNALRKAGLK